nr:aminodeoxychorismate lyase [Gordonia zhaorongruii]
MIVVDGSGEVHDPEAPLLHADDLGALRGDGVFETILIRGGRARLVDEHLRRLADGAAGLDLPAPDPTALRRCIDVAERQWASGDEAALRVICSRGRESVPDGPPTVYVTVGPLPARSVVARRAGVSVMTLERADDPDVVPRAPWELLGVKALSYARNMAALRHAHRAGADDGIYLSSAGSVLESPRANVVAVIDGVLTATPRADGILPGITQAALFATAERRGLVVGERRLTPADLRGADGVWLLSSLTLAARVHALDGERLPPLSVSAPDIAALVDEAVAG